MKFIRKFLSAIFWIGLVVLFFLYGDSIETFTKAITGNITNARVVKVEKPQAKKIHVYYTYEVDGNNYFSLKELSTRRRSFIWAPHQNDLLAVIYDENEPAQNRLVSKVLHDLAVWGLLIPLAILGIFSIKSNMNTLKGLPPANKIELFALLSSGSIVLIFWLPMLLLYYRIYGTTDIYLMVNIAYSICAIMSIIVLARNFKYLKTPSNTLQ